MNNVIPGICLLLVSIAALAQGDIWSKLFQEKLHEANHGNTEAQYDVGTMYQNGRGVKASRAMAVKWFGKAAAGKHPQAIMRLQLMSENEARFDKTRALAVQGDRDSRYELGNMYIKGIGTDIDHARAISAYEQAAEQGSEKAAYKLGLINYEGTGVPVNMNTAFRWFRTAAAGNHHAAQYYLGKMYAGGQGTPRDDALALEWFSKAVDGGFDQARGAMIDVSERLSMKAAARPAAPDPAAPGNTSVAKRPRPGVAPRQAGAHRKGRSWHLDDLMLAAWYRDDQPVTYLPSKISSCRIEADRLICLSDDQTRRAGANLIRYKTKAIIGDLDDEGAFEITYRNLVIDASPTRTADAGGDSAGDSARDSYAVKTGWGTPHTLECRFNDGGTLDCVKNRSYSFELTSPQALATGR